MKKFVLHIGPMKTSTTFAQKMLSESRAHLKSKDWTYPGDGLNQQHAFYGICGSDIPWVNLRTQDENKSAGDDLISELNGLDGSVIASAEALASLSSAGIKRLLNKIPKPETVLFTHRPLEKLLPSAWQQSLKGGGTETLEDFVDRALLQITSGKGNLYQGYAWGDSVERWKNSSKAHIVLMKVPTQHADMHKTWPLFQQAAGIPVLPNLELKEANVSLSLEAANLLKDFNASLKKRRLFNQRIVSAFVKDGLFKNRFGKDKIALGAEHLKRARDIEERQMDKALSFADEVLEAGQLLSAV